MKRLSRPRRSLWLALGLVLGALAAAPRRLRRHRLRDPPLTEVVAEVVAYRRRYGVDAVFADQVTSGEAPLPYYRELAMRLRGAGATRIVLNPGTVPHPGYLELADVVVTFEDDAAAYERWSPPAVRGPAATCHLVHDAPPATHRAVLATAAGRGAGYAFVTDRRMPDPWGGLPAGWGR